MINLDSLRIDVDAAENGKTFTLSSGMVVKLRRTNCKAHKTAMAELLEPHAASIAVRKELPPGVFTDIALKAFASAVIVGWDVVDWDGPFEYTPANAEKLLREPALHDIADELAAIAGSADYFRLAVTTAT